MLEIPRHPPKPDFFEETATDPSKRALQNAGDSLANRDLVSSLLRKSFQTQPALFAPAEVLEHPAVTALDGLEALVDRGEVAALLPRGEGKASTGRPGYPALMLFRALLLGQLYRLSDVQLSSQLMRDRLFRRFCRIELDQSVPDSVTLGRFRAALDGRMEALLALVKRALAAKNLILRPRQLGARSPLSMPAWSKRRSRDPRRATPRRARRSSMTARER